MADKDDSAQLDAIAAEWVARLDRGLDPVGDRARLDAWLETSPHHRGAFVRAQAAWALLDSAIVHTDSEPAKSRSISRRTLLLSGSAAASLAGTAIVLGLRWQDRVATRMGEVRLVSFGEGSRAFINTASSLEVDIRRDSRTIRLEKGEAWFDVAKDPERPFTVEAGPYRVRAIGTAFSVRLQANGTRVLVTSGTVEAWAVTESAPTPIRVSSGSTALVTASTPPRAVAVSAEQIQRELVWREGMISLNSETLGDAAAEFNRFNETKILVDDPKLAAKQIVGYFSASDPRGFAAAVETTLGARVSFENGNIRLNAR